MGRTLTANTHELNHLNVHILNSLQCMMCGHYITASISSPVQMFPGSGLEPVANELDLSQTCTGSMISLPESLKIQMLLMLITGKIADLLLAEHRNSRD